MFPVENRIAIIWNKNSLFAKQLKKKIAKAKKELSNNKITSREKTFLAGCEVITSKWRFEQLNVHHFEKIIVLAELDWNQNKFNDLYGLEVIRKIRFKKIGTNAIAIATFLDWNEFEKMYSEYPVFKEIQQKNYINLSENDLIKLDVERFFFGSLKTKKMILDHFYTKEEKQKLLRGHPNLFREVDCLKLMLQRVLTGNKKYSLPKVNRTWKRIYPQLQLLSNCFEVFQCQAYDKERIIDSFLSDFSFLKKGFEEELLDLTHIEDSIMPPLRTIWYNMFNLPLELQARVKKHEL